MGALSSLEPKEVFDFFEEICAIPRPSRNEKQISDYLVAFANQRNLEVYQDEVWNVIIKKPATAGYENKDTIIMQAHTDMVCVFDDTAEADPALKGVVPLVDKDNITAKGTTLGADDGIGMAYILAVLDSNDFPHPAIEAVFTSSEEVGLDGAKALDVSKLSGRKMINIDTEEENHLVIGCAGGCRSDMTLKYKPVKSKGRLLSLKIGGLVGGHSGVEIDKGSANANVLMGRVLYELASKHNIELVSVRGGDKDNAISTSCEAKILAKKKEVGEIEASVMNICKHLKAEFFGTDPDMYMELTNEGKSKCKVLKKADFAKFLSLVNLIPYGVIKMSQVTPGLVETSINHGILDVSDGVISITNSIRSNITSGKEWKKNKHQIIAETFGAELVFRGEYPSWESNGITDFVKLAAAKYDEVMHKPIEIITIHAGLECALFCEKIPGLEAISIGPEMSGVHTVNEALNIESVQNEWKVIKAILKG